MNLHEELLKYRTRRQFFRDCGVGVGSMGLASLLNERLFAAPAAADDPLAPKKPHFAAKAKSIIYLHMAGAPSTLDLFDYKPKLQELSGQPCPDSYLKGQQFAFIKGHPKLLGTPHKFAKYGTSGQEISEVLPHLQTVADELCIVRSMYTEQFNHAPAQLFVHTGSARLGRPGMGSWLSYGLGTENHNLPSFCVLVSGTAAPDGGASLWGSAFLPTIHQGIQLRSQGDPVLFLSNPDGMDAAGRRQSLDTLQALNQLQSDAIGDPEVLTRIAQYELAYRMQTSVPEVMDISKETKETHEMYGVKPGQKAFANNCLLARRLVESGVRFVQLYHWGWDNHGESKAGDLRYGMVDRCKETDQPVAALIKDLKRRGLLDHTLVVWGGEFGRTPMNEERNGSKWLGRDHHQHTFTIWMAGGGAKAGVTHGTTDELGYYVAENGVHVHDLQATLLHLMGMDHEKLTYRSQGRDYRLTDVHGKVVKEILA
ncbi:MAG TPA: sulfatase [Planctomycetales bacterium]|nr:sulfatase [Planctomycetales bacterium]